MVHKIFGTDLSRHVIVADHVLGLQLKFRTKIRTQLHQGLICTVVKLPRLIGMAALNGNGIAVSVVGRIGHLRKGNALDHLSLQPDHKVTAG